MPVSSKIGLALSAEWEHKALKSPKSIKHFTLTPECYLPVTRMEVPSEVKTPITPTHTGVQSAGLHTQVRSGHCTKGLLCFLKPCISVQKNVSLNRYAEARETKRLGDKTFQRRLLVVSVLTHWDVPTDSHTLLVPGVWCLQKQEPSEVATVLSI